MDDNRVVDKQFVNRRITIDGLEFVRCTFIQCKVIFKATDRFAFRDCTFTDCEWVVEAAALLALQYLSVLYNGLGQEGQALVESIFESVRVGDLGQKLHVAAVPATV